MSGTDHKHPTFGVCECGHLAFVHEWTQGQRVDYQADCTAETPVDLSGTTRRCECEKFHADAGGGE